MPLPAEGLHGADAHERLLSVRVDIRLPLVQRQRRGIDFRPEPPSGEGRSRHADHREKSEDRVEPDHHDNRPHQS